jgi:hypothetical protein
MELRLHLKYGSQGATILGCGRRAQRRWTLIVHADQELPPFLELESAILPLFLGAQQFSDSTIRELLL